MSEKFQNRYRIPTVRAKWHDYNDGIYFITINTAYREQYFGKIFDDKISFSDIGRFLEDQIINIKTHYPYAEIPLHQVMPNHVHLIVFIDTETGKDEVNHVSDDNTIKKTIDAKMQIIALKKGKLSVTIGGLKSAVTRFANSNNIEFKWQSRFHDHIIRDQEELNRIVFYIENNVALWEYDINNVNNDDKNKHAELKEILDINLSKQ